ncbi:MAG: cell surface protein [Blautia sp.]|nr:cell surface protein [Blautia sp.]
MHKKKVQAAMLAMAILMSVSSPAAVLADTIPNSGQELEQEQEETEELIIEEIPVEEEMLSGTADIEEEQEDYFAGTGEQDENLMMKGLSDVEKTRNSSTQEALKKAESYLQKTVTSPVVNTLSGEWSVLAMARGGYLTDYVRNAYLTELYKTLQDNKGILHHVKYTEYSRVVIALSALNISPTSVNGYNLLEPLADFKKVSGQGINGSSSALIALDTKKYEIPELKNGKTQTTRDALIADILGKEIEGGGWALSGNIADPDVTAMTIQSLVPYMSRNDVNAAVNRGIEKLAALQDADGGYSSDFISESGNPVKNLESSAQVVIALSAVDASLIQQETFMKNGKTLLDELLRYQKEDGSFCHVIGDKSDAMATDQGTLALLAWSRAVNGQTRLYDMTDLGSSQEGGESQEETKDKVDAFRKKMEELPQQITIAEKDKVFSLKTELDLIKNFEEKEKFKTLLNAYVSEIEQQEKAVKKLDERIWNEINPLNITLKNQNIVEELLNDLQNIPEANRGYLERLEDLKKAQTIIHKLQEGVLAKEIFETAKEARKDYVHEEKDYTIRLRGKKIKNPADMKAGVEVQEQEGGLYLWLSEDGELPGEIELSVSCTLEDGVYMLYNEKNQEEQWVSVQGKRASFDLTKGGNYILKQANLGYEEDKNLLAGTSQSTVSGTSGKNNSKKTATSNKTKKTETSNTSTANIKGGVVEKKEFEAIKEKDKNLKINSKTDQNQEYILTINGKDIKNAKDMKVGVKEGSKYQKEIEQLAENPYIFSFEEEGDFPGKMQMEITTNQEDGQYLLMKYNDEEKKADYIQKIKVEDKKTKFIIEKGGDYFIAKKVKTKSLNEIEEEEKEEKEIKEDVEDTETNMDTEPVEEEFLTGTKEENALPGVLLAGGGVLVLAGLGAGIWYFRKRK